MTCLIFMTNVPAFAPRAQLQAGGCSRVAGHAVLVCFRLGNGLGAGINHLRTKVKRPELQLSLRFHGTVWCLGRPPIPRGCRGQLNTHGCLPGDLFTEVQVGGEGAKVLTETLAGARQKKRSSPRRLNALPLWAWVQYCLCYFGTNRTVLKVYRHSCLFLSRMGLPTMVCFLYS